ncbi:MAG: hypothetical protein FWG80_00750 [Alphaproteobacteria bacterium]|nr:hypothetical protein [Alphaproteobacteria bacterium]
MKKISIFVLLFIASTVTADAASNPRGNQRTTPVAPMQPRTATTAAATETATTAIAVPTQYTTPAQNAEAELSAAIMTTRTNCAGIVEALEKMRSRAVTTTAVTSIGTAAHGATYVTTDEDTRLSRSKEEEPITVGLTAGAAAANVTGAILAGTNKVDSDLAGAIIKCKDSAENIEQVMGQARLDGADEAILSHAKKIAELCGNFNMEQVSKINNRATGAMVASTTGAVGSIAQVVNQTTDKIKFAGTEPVTIGTTAATLVGAVINATQIKAIGTALQVAKECQNALESDALPASL